MKSGFTLAEVLTTLMVIGVVAAMTIPTLMNSTNDQQLRVAYKKAMSVLGQGVQLMTAKEVQCRVYDSVTLADCFQKNALSGTLSTFDGKSSGGELNTVVTSDGLAYHFLYNSQGDNNTDDTRTIDAICGDGASLFGNTAASYKGEHARCAVFVDLNGLSKGAKKFGNRSDAASIGSGSGGSIALTSGGTEQIPIFITGTGVRPVYNANNSTVSKGWGYMYGTASNPI